jgi:hypothetical protein
MKNMVRHGDLLIVRIDGLPNDAKIVDTNILAEGEVTGHAHKLEGRSKVYQVQQQKYFEVEETVVLTHEEHKSIELEKGTYAVIRQREYSPQANRQVLD